MGEMTERNKMNRIFHFVYSFIIPRIISFDSRGQDKIFEMLQKEVGLNFLVRAKEGTFQELVRRATMRSLLSESLGEKELNYFPHKNEVKGKYMIKLFPFLKGQEALARKEMNFLGYRNCTGCELMDLVFEEKIRMNMVCIVAGASVAKRENNDGEISPSLFIDKKGKFYLVIYNYESLDVNIPLFFLGARNK
jgi:hypothetical protein